MEINDVFNTWANKIVEYCVVKICHESHSVVSSCLGPRGLYSPWNSPGQNTGVGSLSLLQGIFPTQGSNLRLPHCRRTLPAEPQGKNIRSLGLEAAGFPCSAPGVSRQADCLQKMSTL